MDDFQECLQGSVSVRTVVYVLCLCVNMAAQGQILVDCLCVSMHVSVMTMSIIVIL